MKHRLSQQNLSEWLARILKNDTRLIAPVLDEKAHDFFFAEIQSPKLARFDGFTKMSAKEFIFPRHEPLFTYEFEKSSIRIKDVEPQVRKTVIVGLRPCDAAGFAVMDKVFHWDYDDKFYWKRREATTLITMGCSEPLDSCFCTSVGLSPMNDKGSDVLLSPLEDGSFLVESFTDKGTSLVTLAQDLFEPGDHLDRSSVEQKAVAKMVRKENLNELGSLLEKNFENHAWETLSCACMGCGACAMSCPTCHCFDIVDEGDLRGGVRLKNWDCCSFSIFTKHGAGHNPRDQQFKRCRQRYMHKLRYYKEKFGETLCVGCGRCVNVCPVNLDIYSVVTAVKNKEAQ